MPPPPPSHPPAPWKETFTHHLSTLPTPTAPEFVLSTISLIPTSTKSNQNQNQNQNQKEEEYTPVPRARYCIFRGFLASLPPNPHLPASDRAQMNEENVFTSHLLTFTTDARMAKVADIFGEPATTATTAAAARAVAAQGEKNKGRVEGQVEEDGREGLRGSGGGAPIEAVFWLPKASSQWRISGTCYLLSPTDISSPSPSTTKLRNLIEAYLTPSSHPTSTTPARTPWTLPTELKAHYLNLSPAMRSSFTNPPPGTPRSIPPASGCHLPGSTSSGSGTNAASQRYGDEEEEEDVAEREKEKEKEKEKETEKEKEEEKEKKETQLQTAMRYFRLGVIIPTVVECTDLSLSAPADAKRTRWTWRGTEDRKSHGEGRRSQGEESDVREEEQGKWTTEELWP